MVIFCYLLLTRRWSVLRRIYLLPGALLYLGIVLPWYFEMGARHEGYLRYYFWDEHFGRFASDEFDRTQPWYYFILVGLVGFFPWTLLWPFFIAGLRGFVRDDKTLFLLLWAGLPWLFFSASKAKLPHYILPIFPALAMLTAARLVGFIERSADRAKAALSLTWIAYSGLVLYFLIGFWQPVILPQAIVAGVVGMPHSLWLYGAVILFVPLILCLSKIPQSSQANIYLSQAVAMGAFLIFCAHAMIAASSVRSAKALGGAARQLMTPATQVVFYDAYLAGLGYYLQSEKPAWVITHSNKKRTFLGNYYALGKRAEPDTRWGKALFDFDEFGAQWRSAPQPLLILAKAKSRARLEQHVGETTKELASVGEYVWLTKP
jgi:4-amino-4-deoxy-L-arabinose transferase-like glycosyltransferase